MRRQTCSAMPPAGVIGMTGMVAVAVCLVGAGAARAEQASVPGATGESELHWAARFNAVEAIQALIAAGADMDARDEDGRTPLHWAAAADAAAAVEALIAAGADATVGSGDGGAPLHAAARANASSAFQALVAHAGGGEAEALHAAAAVDDVQMAQLLLAAGVNGEAVNATGQTVLETAVTADAAGVLQLLAANGVRMQVRDRSLRDRPLHMAARANAGNAVAVLLAHGASIEMPNPAGDTPLHTAAGADAVAVAAVLLAHGASRVMQNRAGRTPLAVAEEQGAAAVAVLLRAP